LLFKTNRFSRLFPTIGSQIITEPRSLEDFPCLERTSCPTDGETVAASKTIASQFLEPVLLGTQPGIAAERRIHAAANPNNLTSCRINPAFLPKRCDRTFRSIKVRRSA